MHRQPLLKMLSLYLIYHPAESETVDRIKQLVVSSPDCFERTCRPGHITASAWVLSHDRSRCLLVHHRKLNRWLQPGGHADGDNNVLEVALREVREETGLTELKLVETHDGLGPFDLDVHAIPARFDSTGNQIEDAHEHHDVRFLFRAAPDQELALSEESHDLRWFTDQQVRQQTDEESILRMLHKAGPMRPVGSV